METTDAMTVVMVLAPETTVTLDVVKGIPAVSAVILSSGGVVVESTEADTSTLFALMPKLI